MSGAFPPVNSGPLNGAAPFLRLSKAMRRRFKIKNLKAPAVTNAKRGLLRAVPNARRAGVNFKKLPLISHKAAANRTDALEVMTA